MDIKEKVRKLLEKEVGFEDNYYFKSVDNVIDKIYSLDKNPKERILYQLTHEEDIRVAALNSVIKLIETDLIDRRINYLHKGDNPKDEFEKGVMTVIRLIQFRIHCIMD